MLRFPHAKINIGLYITARRPDGYHDLETVFYPIPLRDALEVLPAPEGSGTTLETSGLPVPGDISGNLAYRAHRLMQDTFPGRVPDTAIHLHKHIPMGGGLGGGSSDGAFMLKMLSELFVPELPAVQLGEMALLLGSDCPFFLEDGPRFATGRGEKLLPATPDLSGHIIQLICPRMHISTAAAFAGIHPRPAGFDLRRLGTLAPAQWRKHVSNDFEVTVFEQYPCLKDIKAQLYRQGAVYASLSGTGASVYGIFRKGEKACISSGLEFEEYLFDC